MIEEVEKEGKVESRKCTWRLRVRKGHMDTGLGEDMRVSVYLSLLSE